MVPGSESTTTILRTGIMKELRTKLTELNSQVFPSPQVSDNESSHLLHILHTSYTVSSCMFYSDGPAS